MRPVAMRILFTSAHTLLDPGSGAARSVATLLAGLGRRGHEVLALTGSLQDGAGDPGALARLSRFDAGALRVGEVAGLRHEVLRFDDTRIEALRVREAEALHRYWSARMRAFRPDVVMTFGGLVYNRLVLAEAAGRGVGTAFYLGGPGYAGREAFESADAVLSVSLAVAAQCGLAGDPRVHAILPAVDLANYEVAARAPEFVLFVNPQAAKGCGVLSAVAARSEALGRAHRFLVVESRGTLAGALAQFPALRARRNLTVLPRQHDMREVYRRTHTLMFPSLWFEAAGRVVREAAVNGIPVLAHRVGGIAEALPGGAWLLDPPEELLRDWTAPVPEGFVAAWLDALDRLRDDALEYAAWAARARDAARSIDLPSQVARVERILEDARAKGTARRVRR